MTSLLRVLQVPVRLISSADDMESVRLDKYLWAIRVYKTRTDATDACKGGNVRLNGYDVKPSKEVKPGDVIVARKGAVSYTYKVLELVDKDCMLNIEIKDIGNVDLTVDKTVELVQRQE